MSCHIVKVSSLHIDASVILWSSTDRQALCKLCLPPLVTPQQCVYTSDGKRLLVVAGKVQKLPRNLPEHSHCC